MYKYIITILICAFFSNLVKAQQQSDDVRAILQKDDVEKLSQLLRITSIDSCYQNMYTMLSMSIQSKAPKCFDLLMKKNADPNISCDYKAPVFLVCKYGDLNMLKKLEKKGANLIPPKYEGKYTLLEYAQKYNNQPIINYLKSLKK